MKFADIIMNILSFLSFIRESVCIYNKERLIFCVCSHHVKGIFITIEFVQ